MKSLSPLCLRLNGFLNHVRARRLLLREGKLKFTTNLDASLRYKTTKTIEGPDLKHFLMKEQLTKVKNVRVDSEVLPYVNELSLSGEGQKVYFKVQGCQMNISDIEIVWSILKKNGYEKTNDLIEADVVLIITCAIRETAEIKIWQGLHQLKAFKVKHKKKNMKIGLLGCMAERLKNKIIEVNKAVDLVAGPDSYKDLPRLLALTRSDQKAVNVLLSLDETYADVQPVRLDENSVTSYVSIQRGCDNMCTYCIVPFTRGRERSRPIDSILDEVRMLSDQGVKQVTLLGQNVNSYRDTSSCSESTEATKMSAGFKAVYKVKKGGLRFDVLLDKVSEINPNMRVRFTAPHPKDFPDEVLHLIRERKNICESLHLPFQSGSTAVLERMRRGHTKEAYLDLVNHVRSILPNVFFSTDIIIGFCGETEEDHEETLDVIRTVEFNTVFFYPYSMREKTTAHRRYVDDVPQEIKIRRVTEVDEVSKLICRRLNKAQINQCQLVLVDGFSKKSNEFFQGRNDGNIKVIFPSCDIPVGVNSNVTKPIQPGDYIAVNITYGDSRKLKGVPLYHTSIVEFQQPQEIGLNQTGIKASGG